MKTIEQLLASGSRYELSLGKLLGGPVVADVLGYVSNEFGEPTFKLTRLELTDGTRIGVEGEHDFPYLTPDTDAPTALQPASLRALYNQSKG